VRPCIFFLRKRPLFIDSGLQLKGYKGFQEVLGAIVGAQPLDSHCYGQVGELHHLTLSSHVGTWHFGKVPLSGWFPTWSYCTLPSKVL
jgi:hypothetical protein